MQSLKIASKILATDTWSKARVTELHLRHGIVRTPVFMPVATQAVLRGVDVATAEAMEYQILLANTYHLLLRPGIEVFRNCGGIHQFMKWPRAVLTDSGGFQIFSLSKQLHISEEGAHFRSYVDGLKILLSPESSIEMQRAIGSDIMMVLDHCIPSTSSWEATKEALELTTRWARRSFEARGDSDQGLFGIVQGARFHDLRRESAAQICEIPFDGFALGGLAVGESRAEREDVVAFAASLLPYERPRYLMGVGTPVDLLEAVRCGIDMFDCILPTSLAHQGVTFTSRGKIDLRRGVYANQHITLDEKCNCSTCTRFTRAYLHHLVEAGERMAGTLLSIHNLSFYQKLIKDMQQSISAGEFRALYNERKQSLESMDLDNPTKAPKQRSQSPSLSLGNYEVVEAANGTASIRQKSTGETMHSVVDPVFEAQQLYIDQSGIITSAKIAGNPITVWDVGLGAATNSMVCIRALEKETEIFRPVQIQSFENDLDSLRLALRHSQLFKYLWHAAPHALLEKHEWQSANGKISWELVEGDFTETMQEAAIPDIIWFDPFSAKADSELWKGEVFQAMADHCRNAVTTLYTYSNSTAVRALLLAAGWYVGRGKGTGPKEETTMAYSVKAAEELRPSNLLGEEWLTRWSRSDARAPLLEQDPDLDNKLRVHPQFSLTTMEN